jgi:hypothetical protein
MEAARPLRRLHVGEGKEARLGLQGSFVPSPFFRVKNFSIFQTIFQFANYFDFNSNLNFQRFLLAK